MSQVMPPEDGNVTIRGCFVNQPIGEFFVGSVGADILRKISYTAIRRLESREVETYAGIQRPLNPTRVKQIHSYIGTADATFPTSIIIAIASDNIIDQDNSSLTIRIGEDVAKVIDGQHRLAGFDEYNSRGFELVVSIFVDISEEEQALIFSIINLKQTRVDKSLVYDLFDLATTRSPQKTAHDVAKILNLTPGSPLERRIKLLGRNPTLGDEILYKAPLTQATVVGRLLKMISNNPDFDRDLLMRKKSVELSSTDVDKGLIFRKYFAQDDDASIVRIMMNYFNAVKNTFPDQWADTGNPISKTIGFGALMRLLQKDLYPIGEREKNLREEFFYQNLSRAKHLRFQFSPEGKYSPAGKGETDLYNDLRGAILDNA